MTVTTKHARRLVPGGYAHAKALALNLAGSLPLSEYRAPWPWEGTVTVLSVSPWRIEYRTDAHDRLGEVWRADGFTLYDACVNLVKVVDHD